MLIVPDELSGWKPPDELKGVDLEILPIGIVEFNPLTDERSIPEDHPVLKSEATFEQTLEVIRLLKAKRVILTHIEEPDGPSYNGFQLVGKHLRAQGLNIDFAYDTLIIDV